MFQYFQRTICDFNGTVMIRISKIKNEAFNQVGELLHTTIPMSTKVNQAAILQQPLLSVDKNSKVRKAFETLAQEIVQRVK